MSATEAPCQPEQLQPKRAARTSACVDVARESPLMRGGDARRRAGATSGLVRRPWDQLGQTNLGPSWTGTLPSRIAWGGRPPATTPGTNLRDQSGQAHLGHILGARRSDGGHHPPRMPRVCACPHLRANPYGPVTVHACMRMCACPMSRRTMGRILLQHAFPGRSGGPPWTGTSLVVVGGAKTVWRCHHPASTPRVCACPHLRANRCLSTLACPGLQGASMAWNADRHRYDSLARPPRARPLFGLVQPQRCRPQGSQQSSQSPCKCACPMSRRPKCLANVPVQSRGKVGEEGQERRQLLHLHSS